MITTWADIQTAIDQTNARNVTVRTDCLMGNDGTVLTRNLKIAAGYVKTDWDAVNCCQTR